jgi:hypothetical protein
MSDAPSGFGHFARRWGQWASNLLVSGVVIVVAIALGREVLQWWYVDPAPMALGRPNNSGAPADVTLDDPLGLPGTSEELRFGELPFAFGHGVVEGKAEKAVDVLARECERAAALADAAEREPGPAEQRLLALLQGEKPRIGRRRHRWSTYVIARPVPMAVAVSGSEQIARGAATGLGLGFAAARADWKRRQQVSVAVSQRRRPVRRPTATRWGWFTWRPSRSDATSSDADSSLAAAARRGNARSRFAPRMAAPASPMSARARRTAGARRSTTGSPTMAGQGKFAHMARRTNRLPRFRGGVDSAKASQWQKLGRSWTRRYRLESRRWPAEETGWRPKPRIWFTAQSGESQAGVGPANC